MGTNIVMFSLAEMAVDKAPVYFERLEKENAN